MRVQAEEWGLPLLKHYEIKVPHHHGHLKWVRLNIDSNKTLRGGVLVKIHLFVILFLSVME